METRPRQFRLGEDTLDQLDALGVKWGGTLSPTPRAVVIREVTRRVWEQEGRPKGKAHPSVPRRGRPRAADAKPAPRAKRAKAAK